MHIARERDGTGVRMSDGASLYAEIQSQAKKLDTAVRSLRKPGMDYAAADRDYRIILRKEALQLRDDGMAIGLIDKTVFGIPSVADARFKRDVAEAVYKANIESINAIKVYIKVLVNQYDKEWGNAGNE